MKTVAGKSSSVFEIHREGEVDYSKPLARALLRDSRLSFAARGLFAFLWDLPCGWKTNSIHLAGMSPQGRDAVRTLLKELEAVGAMRDEAIRGKGGRLAGRRWVLVTPERWAIEFPLSTHQTPETAPGAGSTERRVFRSSENPKVGKPTTKVYQGEGDSKKTTTASPEPGAYAGSGSALAFDGLKIEPVIAPFFPQLRDVLRHAGITDTALAQDLLDELAGNIEAGIRGDRQKVGNPVSWLQSVANGEFKRVRCFEVLARRRSAKAHEQWKATDSEFVPDPLTQAKGEAFIANLRRRHS
ncbi:MAG: hypothetical protein ACYC2E_03405 [Sulfuricella sp.]